MQRALCGWLLTRAANAPLGDERKELLRSGEVSLRHARRLQRCQRLQDVKVRRTQVLTLNAQGARQQLSLHLNIVTR